MTTIDDGGPAYPVPGNPATMPGMSLRDWFAGQVMAGLAANPSPRFCEWNWDVSAAQAYVAADAMLAARKGGAA